MEKLQMEKLYKSAMEFSVVQGMLVNKADALYKFSKDSMEWDDAYQNLTEQVLIGFTHLKNEKKLITKTCYTIGTRTMNLFRKAKRLNDIPLNSSVRWDTTTIMEDYNFNRTQTVSSDVKVALFYAKKELQRKGKLRCIELMHLIEHGFSYGEILNRMKINSKMATKLKGEVRNILIKYGLEEVNNVFKM